MIFVDTSVWVAAQRSPVTSVATTLKQLLDADEVALALPVRLELLAGTAKRHRPALRHGLSALPLSIPSDETWKLIESWVGPSADAGYRFSIPDLLIGGLAHELGALIWSLDGDFRAMETLGFARLYR